MAKNAPKVNTREDFLSRLDQPEPPFFKLGRDAALQLAEVERDLFSDTREVESGNCIISGLTRQVSELDFSSFTFAIGQILYNQSYKSGNEDVNSGISRTRANKISNQTGTEYFAGEIEVSLNELCRLAHGTEPTTEIKKKMETLIDTFHNTPIKVKFPNGDTIESYLCTKQYKTTRAKDGAILYRLYLNPIFGSRIKNQFGELPQDIIKTLDIVCKRNKQRKTAAHYLLLRWLSVQDKRTPHKLNIDTIIHELRMEEYFKKNKGIAENQILTICKSMEEIGILSYHEVAYRETGRGKRIDSITFHLNQNFIRTPKRAEGTPGETSGNKTKTK